MSVSVGRRGGAWRRFVVAAIAGASAIATGVAGAAPTSALVYSVDDGATWSAHVNAAPGQTVLVRQFFDNGGTTTIGAASLSTTLPAGFTRVAGSTKVCLAPGTTNPTAPSAEQVCNTDPGEGGAIAESSVWSGSALTISPSAGLFGQSTGARTGLLVHGTKRYLSLVDCTYSNGHDQYTASIATTILNTWLHAGTAASNTAATTASCGPGALGYSPVAANSGVENIALLGRADLSLQNCTYLAGTDHLTLSIPTTPGAAQFGAGTSATNAPPSTPTCAPGTAAAPLVPSLSGAQTLDLVHNRYLHLDNCTYMHGSDLYTSSISTISQARYRARTTISNAATGLPRCGSGGNDSIALLVSGVQIIDLADRTRGQGFVQFAMVAPHPTSTTTYAQAGHLTATHVAVASTGSITVDPAIGASLVAPIGLAVIVIPVGLVLAGTRRRKVARR